MMEREFPRGIEQPERDRAPLKAVGVLVLSLFAAGCYGSRQIEEIHAAPIEPATTEIRIKVTEPRPAPLAIGKPIVVEPLPTPSPVVAESTETQPETLRPALSEVEGVEPRSQLLTFAWNGQTVAIKTEPILRQGEETFVVTIDGQTVQRLPSPNREFPLSFHPASGFRSEWNETNRTLTLVLQSGRPIWGLKYQFANGQFELANVDAYEPKMSELNNPQIDLLAQSAELFASGESEHKQLERLADRFVEILHSGDEERLRLFFLETRSHLSDRHWQQFWEEDLETFHTYGPELMGVVLDKTTISFWDRGPVYRLKGLPFGLHVRWFTRPDGKRAAAASFYFFETH